MKFEPSEFAKQVRGMIRRLDQDERAWIFGGFDEYCPGCGRWDPACQCYENRQQSPTSGISTAVRGDRETGNFSLAFSGQSTSVVVGGHLSCDEIQKALQEMPPLPRPA